MNILIDIPEKLALDGFERSFTEDEKDTLVKAIGNGTPLIQEVLVDALMEERIRGSLKSDMTFRKDI